LQEYRVCTRRILAEAIKLYMADRLNAEPKVKVIAKRIIHAAGNGERDLVRLRDAGLTPLGFDDDREAS
jgi:hypothetical protein